MKRAGRAGRGTEERLSVARLYLTAALATNSNTIHNTSLVFWFAVQHVIRCSCESLEEQQQFYSKNHLQIRKWKVLQKRNCMTAGGFRTSCSFLFVLCRLCSFILPIGGLLLCIAQQNKKQKAAHRKLEHSFWIDCSGTSQSRLYGGKWGEQCVCVCVCMCHRCLFAHSCSDCVSVVRPR